MTKDWHVYAIHILEAIDRIDDYYSRLGAGTVEADIVYDAILRNLETLTEAAAHKLPDAIKAKHDDIDWEGIYGMRVRLAHIYLDIDRNVINQTIEGDLPKLREAMLEEIPDWKSLKKDSS